MPPADPEFGSLIAQAFESAEPLFIPNAPLQDRLSGTGGGTHDGRR
jgi:hypothetical protein